MVMRKARAKLPLGRTHPMLFTILTTIWGLTRDYGCTAFRVSTRAFSGEHSQISRRGSCGRAYTRYTAYLRRPIALFLLAPSRLRGLASVCTFPKLRNQLWYRLGEGKR